MSKHFRRRVNQEDAEEDFFDGESESESPRVAKRRNIVTGKAKSDEIVSNRVVKLTKDQYKKTFAFITSYCAERIEGSIDENGNLRIPMDQAHLETFLGDMSADRPDGSCKAISTLTGYCTVIKFYYHENGVEIDENLKRYFKSFHDGVKRNIAGKKSVGLMKNY